MPLKQVNKRDPADGLDKKIKRAWRDRHSVAHSTDPLTRISPLSQRLAAPAPIVNIKCINGLRPVVSCAAVDLPAFVVSAPYPKPARKHHTFHSSG